MRNNTHLHEYCISYTCDIPYDLTGHAFNLNKQKRILTTLLTAQAACEPHQQQQYQKKMRMKTSKLLTAALLYNHKITKKEMKEMKERMKKESTAVHSELKIILANNPANKI